MADIEQWRAFVKVVECGSFARAAEHLHTARSAVSRRVSELEAHLGANLIRRSTRNLSVTETGEAFFERARQLLQEFDELESETVRGHHGASGHIRLAAPLSFTMHHLQPVLATFRERFPHVTLELKLGDRRVDLISESFDFALRIGADIEPSLVAKRLCTIRHALAASPAYLQRRGHPVHPQDLARHAILAYGNLRKPSAWTFFGDEGRDPVEVRLSPTVLCDNGELLLSLACRGEGIVCEPTFLLHEAIAAGHLTPVLPQWQWPLWHAYLVYPAHRRVPTRVRLLMDLIVDAISDPPPWDEAESGSDAS